MSSPSSIWCCICSIFAWTVVSSEVRDSLCETIQQNLRQISTFKKKILICVIFQCLQEFLKLKTVHFIIFIYQIHSTKVIENNHIQSRKQLHWTQIWISTQIPLQTNASIRRTQISHGILESKKWTSRTERYNHRWMGVGNRNEHSLDFDLQVTHFLY